MSQFFQIHPDNPQLRLIRQAVVILRENGLIAYPTDSSYALGWMIGNKEATEQVEQIRRLGKNHDFTLICRDLSDISTYAKIDNSQYRLLRSATPGPFTFILPATRELPRRLQNPKGKTVGIRVPDHTIARALLDELGEPMMSSTLLLPGDELPLNDPDEIRERLETQLDLIVDGGPCSIEPTTVLDLTESVPQLLRQGRGDASQFL
jgi:tRNA threonylcarbamoyl adenosine modification protein (Sua5/YciO/YrdC/YwlC family)